MHSGGRGGSAVPSRAVAEIDVRTAPGIGHKDIVRKVHQVLAPSALVSAALRFSITSCTPGLEALPSASLRHVVDRACRAGYGTPAVYLRSGGTIPAVGVLAALFATSPLLLGLGSPGGRAHGPDEFLDIEGWRRGVHTSIALLNGLARTRRLNTC
jgi:succinyl-diaminopimelate desuccinylase